jgi:hypothetical protein
MSPRFREAQCVREFYPARLRSVQSVRATARSSGERRNLSSVYLFCGALECERVLASL